MLRFKLVCNICLMAMRFQKIKLRKKYIFLGSKNFRFFSQSHFLREIHFFKNEILDFGEIFGGGIFFDFFSFHSKKYFFWSWIFFSRYNFDVEFPPLSISEGFRAIRVLLHGFWSRFLFVPVRDSPE